MQHLNERKDKKSHDNCNRCRKSLKQTLTSFHHKFSDETRKRRDVPQNNKGYIQEL
jgi:hypothetical protein